MPYPLAIAVSQASGWSVTYPMRTGWSWRSLVASQYSRHQPLSAGAATNGSPSSSWKEICSRAASGWVAGSATQRGSLSSTSIRASSWPGNGSRSKAASTSPLASPALGSDQAACCMSTRQPGRRWANAAMIRWVASLAALDMNPIRSTWAARLAAVVVSRSASSQPASTAGVLPASTWPAGVRVIPARDRMNNRTPSWLSSCLICLVSAGRSGMWNTGLRLLRS
jgi:hypothetical protein